MKILVKFPSRSRHEKFLSTLKGYIQNQQTQDVTYLITIDEDDTTMNNIEMLSTLDDLGCLPIIGKSNNKIHAINRDMSVAPDFDILVLASDDMICQVNGWDKVLQDEMKANYPDTDGVLFHWDGDPNTKKHNNGRGLNTMCIMGAKYFGRFGYIYHPAYISLWCDNHFTDVADMLGRQFRSDIVLFKHVHYSNTPGMNPDALMQKTQSYYQQDKITYEHYRRINFGLR